MRLICIFTPWEVKRTHIEFVTRLKSVQPGLTVVGRYTHSKTLLKVVDKLGTEYMCLPTNLLRGSAPSIGAAVDKTECFIVKSRLVHGDKYDYSHIRYELCSKKVEIVCKTHGLFSQTPSNHLLGHGCSKCSCNTPPASQREKANFTKKLKCIHPELNVIGDFKGATTKILVEDKGGIRYLATPSGMLKGSAPTIQLAVDKNKCFKHKAIEIHGNKYDYQFVEYLTSRMKVKIKCNNHGVFEQNPSKHLQGHGCIKCGDEGIPGGYEAVFRSDPNKHVPLYVVKCTSDSEVFYKIGLSIDYKVRHRAFPYKVEHLKLIEGRLYETFPLEQLCIDKYKEHQYTPNIKFGGHTECFSINPLEHFEELK